MKRITLIIIGIVFYINNFFSQGQIENLVNTVIPPSPTVASLNKFGDIPLTLRTGTPNICVPLWEITQGKIKVPIAASYQASVIGVEEIPIWIGIVWVLNAVGDVTRKTYGKPDGIGFITYTFLRV